MLLPFGRGYHEKELWFGPTRGIPIIWKTSHILLSLQDVHLTTTKLCCSFLDISPTSQIRRYECQNLPKSSILRENPSGHPCPLFLLIISRPNLDIFFMSIKKDEQEISLIKKHLKKKLQFPRKKKSSKIVGFSMNLQQTIHMDFSPKYHFSHGFPMVWPGHMLKVRPWSPAASASLDFRTWHRLMAMIPLGIYDVWWCMYIIYKQHIIIYHIWYMIYDIWYDII